MPSPANYPQHERDCDTAVLEASRLAWVVHEYDREQVAQLVTHLEKSGRVRDVLVALAAMIDVERPLSEMLAWVHDRHDSAAVAATRKPWQRESYPVCLPELDGAPAGCTSPHGTQARHTAGCRGEGCVQARKDYDAWRYATRASRADDTYPDDANKVSDAAQVC